MLSGDRDAYAELVQAHQAKILRLCNSLLADTALAEDAAQETFLKAYQALSSFRGQSSFSTWLYRIASNRCLDLLRKRKRERTESWEQLIEEAGEQLPSLLQSPPNAADSLANKELVQRLLSLLPPDYRLVLTLREMEGLSYEELACALHCSADAVKSRLRRARQELLKYWRHFSRTAGV